MWKVAFRTLDQPLDTTWGARRGASESGRCTSGPGAGPSPSRPWRYTARWPEVLLVWPSWILNRRQVIILCPFTLALMAMERTLLRLIAFLCFDPSWREYQAWRNNITRAVLALFIGSVVDHLPWRLLALYIGKFEFYAPCVVHLLSPIRAERGEIWARHKACNLRLSNLSVVWCHFSAAIAAGR